MRIGLSCTTIEPALTLGKIDGIGTYTKNLYEAFLQGGKTVIPLSFPHGKIAHSSLPDGRLFPSSYTKSMMTSLMNPLQSHDHHLNQYIDFFHTTDHMIPKFKKIPVIATVHDA